MESNGQPFLCSDPTHDTSVSKNKSVCSVNSDDEHVVPSVVESDLQPVLKVKKGKCSVNQVNGIVNSNHVEACGQSLSDSQIHIEVSHNTNKHLDTVNESMGFAEKTLDGNICKDTEHSCCNSALENDVDKLSRFSQLSIQDDKADFTNGVEYVVYQSEHQMPDIMRLITKDLSEPYSIYTYRYFIHNWPKLCFLVSILEMSIILIASRYLLSERLPSLLLLK